MRFGNVNPGDRFRPTATEWNMIRKMLSEWSGDSGARASFSTTNAGDGLATVRIKNESEENVPAFGILEIAGPLFEHDENEARRAALNQGVVVKGFAPTGAKPIAICLKSVPRGGIGKAIVLGATPCKIDVKSESHQFAMPVKDETEHLESAESGDIRILAKPEGDGVKVGYVMLGGGGAAEKNPYIIDAMLYDWPEYNPDTSDRVIPPYSLVRLSSARTNPNNPLPTRMERYSVTRVIMSQGAVSHATSDDINDFTTTETRFLNSSQRQFELKYPEVSSFAEYGYGVTLEDSAVGESSRVYTLHRMGRFELTQNEVLIRVYSEETLQSGYLVMCVPLTVAAGKQGDRHTYCTHEGALFAMCHDSGEARLDSVGNIVVQVVEKLEGDEWPPDEYLCRIVTRYVETSFANSFTVGRLDGNVASYITGGGGNITGGTNDRFAIFDARKRLNANSSIFARNQNNTGDYMIVSDRAGRPLIVPEFVPDGNGNIIGVANTINKSAIAHVDRGFELVNEIQPRYANFRSDTYSNITGGYGSDPSPPSGTMLWNLTHGDNGWFGLEYIEPVTETDEQGNSTISMYTRTAAGQ